MVPAKIKPPREDSENSEFLAGTAWINGEEDVMDGRRRVHELLQYVDGQGRRIKYSLSSSTVTPRLFLGCSFGGKTILSLAHHY